MAQIIRFKHPDDEYCECGICGASQFHVVIRDDPDDEDCFLIVGMECCICGSFQGVMPVKM